MKMAITINICVITILMYILSIFITSQRVSSAMPKKMVIDTDAGGDDALAIMLAVIHEVKTHDIEVVAITCTYGNTYLKNVEQNVLKILTVANRSDIPVYSGSQKPLINTYTSDNFYGSDGFGDFNFTQNITAKLNKTQHASVFLVDLVKRYQNEITIVSLGALTNIAIAVSLEPNFLHLVKKHVIMGSNISLSSNSNKIEFNFKQDPESDWIILNNTNKLSTVLPIDTIYANPISKEEYRELFNGLNPSIANLLSQAERLASEKTLFWEAADGITMAIVLQPEIMTESNETNLTPVIQGDARGSVELDPQKVHNAQIVLNFDVKMFKDLVTKTLS